MSTARERLVGLAATVATVALVAGLPVLLITIDATPAPTSLPSWDTVLSSLTARDDGTLLLRVLAGLTWAAWAFLTLTIALDVWARLRGMTVPALPGLALPQSAAHTLVGAAVLLFAATPALAPPSSAAAAAPPAATAHPWHTTAVAAASMTSATTEPGADPTAAPLPAQQQTAAAQRPAAAATVRHTVAAGESLWSIARDHLGDGTRYREIAALNTHVIGGDPDLIHPGTTLTLPAARAAGSDPELSTYIVQRGDTLSGIAQRTLGDAGRYPEILDASAHTTQPGGAHLRDPDVIDVGWALTIPTDHANPLNSSPRGDPAGRSPAAPDLRDRSTGAAAPARPTAASPDRGAPGSPVTAPTRSAPPATTPATMGSAPPPGQPAEAPATSSPAFSPWLLAGLTGGPVLAGSMWMLLRRRRAAQSRHRRPGHTFPTPPAMLAPVEKTLATIGPAAAATIEHVDTALRALASARARTGDPMPALVGAELAPAAVIAHLARPDKLPHPWTDTGGDGRTWQVRFDTDPDSLGELAPGQPAPYPLLVTIGTTDTGNPWLLNLEDLTVTLTGDPTNTADLARYIAAEIACNPWSAGVSMHCTGPAADLAPLNPDRIHPHPDHPQPSEGENGADTVLADAVATIDRAAHEHLDTITARAHQVGDDTWPARILLLDAAHAHTPVVGQLIDLVTTHPGSTGTAVIITGTHPHPAAAAVQLTAHGRVLLPSANLDLVAVGLTSDEARGCAALLAATTTVTNTAMPVDDTAPTGWRSYTDHAGALRREHTLPRHTPDPDVGEPAQSILPTPDEDYLTRAATTAADLATLAPKVTTAVSDALHRADPTLDDDLAAWFAQDCPLPRLSLLGPVTARTRGTALTERKPYMTEVLTYLATRPHGTTPDQLAHVMGIQTDKARAYACIVREWLGTNPRTGTPHLPVAQQAPAAKSAGVRLYQVIDILIDADLFRRLRARAQTRGPDGLADLDTALTLVRGRPFDQRREGGWAWLHEGDRLDQHLVCAIVDVAHIAVTAHLAAGEHAQARAAAETALLAAPEEDIPRLDLARVAHAEGLNGQAQAILHQDVYNRTDDDNVPPDLPERTAQVVATGRWARDQTAS